MAFVVSEFQKQFREALNAEGQANFDQVVTLANSVAGAPDFIAALPDQFKEVLKNETTVEGAVSKVLEVSGWAKADGTAVDYKEPKAAVAGKAKAAKPTAAKKEVDPNAPPKKRGNAEALAKAREARGGKTPEQLTADHTAIQTAIVARLEAAGKGVLVHVKTVCTDVVASLTGKLSGGSSTNDNKVYEVIQQWVKAGNAPFVGELMEGRKKGYKLPA